VERSEKDKSIIIERACKKLNERSKKGEFTVSGNSADYEIALYEVCSKLQINPNQVWFVMIGRRK
jgi:hypothetical protein